MPVVVDPNKCNGCEECLNSCPSDAIDMKDGKAVINEYCNSCMACLSVCPEGAISETDELAGAAAETKGSAVPLTDYKGVMVFAEQRGGLIASVSFELLGEGRKLADILGTELSAALLGAGEQAARELIRWGADRVYLCNDPSLEKFIDEAYASVLSEIISAHRPSIVLAGATAIGRSFLPRVAARLNTGLTADCTSLEIDSETGELVQVRPAFGGNIMAAILCTGYRPQMATVRPRVMKRGEYRLDREGEVVTIRPRDTVSRTEVLETVKEESEASANLHEADVIVAAGRGIGDAKNFSLIEELADVLGGAVGATRPVVDEGWIGYSHQVGQTGRTVNPKIYIACGISGAVQHLVGMQSSDIIIAINKNPDAPIFDIATYGIVGDLKEVVPVLIRKIREAKGG